MGPYGRCVEFLPGHVHAEASHPGRVVGTQLGVVGAQLGVQPRQVTVRWAGLEGLGNAHCACWAVLVAALGCPQVLLAVGVLLGCTTVLLPCLMMLQRVSRSYKGHQISEKYNTNEEVK